MVVAWIEAILARAYIVELRHKNVINTFMATPVLISLVMPECRTSSDIYT
jgi:hypothetical protein